MSNKPNEGWSCKRSHSIRTLTSLTSLRNRRIYLHQFRTAPTRRAETAQGISKRSGGDGTPDTPRRQPTRPNPTPRKFAGSDSSSLLMSSPSHAHAPVRIQTQPHSCARTRVRFVCPCGVSGAPPPLLAATLRLLPAGRRASEPNLQPRRAPSRRAARGPARSLEEEAVAERGRLRVGLGPRATESATGHCGQTRARGGWDPCGVTVGRWRRRQAKKRWVHGREVQFTTMLTISLCVKGAPRRLLNGPSPNH